jgi:MioC protein
LNIRILFATETGNAETLAEDLEGHLGPSHDVSVCSLADPAAILPEHDLVLIISSTHGEGEMPKAAQSFCDALTSGSLSMRELKFAVFGLGDSHYSETFARGGALLGQHIIAGDGIQVLALEIHDASGDEFMDDQAKPWADRVVQTVADRASALGQ